MPEVVVALYDVWYAHDATYEGIGYLVINLLQLDLTDLQVDFV